MRMQSVSCGKFRSSWSALRWTWKHLLKVLSSGLRRGAPVYSSLHPLKLKQEVRCWMHIFASNDLFSFGRPRIWLMPSNCFWPRFWEWTGIGITSCCSMRYLLSRVLLASPTKSDLDHLRYVRWRVCFPGIFAYPYGTQVHCEYAIS